MNSILFFTFILSFITSSHSACVGSHGLCNEDCDCCGYGTDPGIRCEVRKAHLGRRCYISGNIGRPCHNSQQCKSQYCNPATNKCAFKPKILYPPAICPLTMGEAFTIDGEPIQHPAGCTCDVAGANEAAGNAVDGDLSTVYSNTRPLTSGLLLHPSVNGPITEMNLCSKNDCPECNPSCYKLEGYCSDTDTYDVVKTEAISFTAGAPECQTFPISSRSLYSHYKLTFDCQAAPPLECSEGSPVQCTCENGLTPYVPETVVPGTCNGVVPTDPPPKPLEFLSSTKVGAYTEIVYRIQEPGPLRTDATSFKYAILQWDNNCCFDCYDAFLDANGNGALEPDVDEPCSEQCDSIADLDSLLLTNDDPNLCMTGIKLYNDQIVASQTYFFKLKIYGDVTMVDKPYGIYSLTGGGRRSPSTNPDVAYGTIKSPVCSCEATNSGGGQCSAYPMQIAEVSFGGKCSQLTSI